MELASEVAGPLGLLPPSHPLYLGIRPRVLGESIDGTNSIHPATLGLACGGPVQGRGAGADEKQAVGLWSS